MRKFLVAAVLALTTAGALTLTGTPVAAAPAAAGDRTGHFDLVSDVRFQINARVRGQHDAAGRAASSLRTAACGRGAAARRAAARCGAAAGCRTRRARAAAALHLNVGQHVRASRITGAKAPGHRARTAATLTAARLLGVRCLSCRAGRLCREPDREGRRETGCREHSLHESDPPAGLLGSRRCLVHFLTVQKPIQRSGGF